MLCVVIQRTSLLRAFASFTALPSKRSSLKLMQENVSPKRNRKVMAVEVWFCQRLETASCADMQIQDSPHILLQLADKALGGQTGMLIPCFLGPWLGLKKLCQNSHGLQQFRVLWN